jgi:hypothetical protein
MSDAAEWCWLLMAHRCQVMSIFRQIVDGSFPEPYYQLVLVVLPMDKMDETLHARNVLVSKEVLSILI